LPTWIAYMGKVLKDVPETFMPQPDGLVALDAPGNKVVAKEYFYKENAPAEVEPEPELDPNIKPLD